MNIGDRIRLQRTRLDISQTELAKRAGYSDRTAISKFENAGDDITMKQVKRVAKALGVSTEYLMGWQEEPTPEEAERAKRIIEDYAENGSDARHTDTVEVISEEDKLLLYRLHKVRQSTRDSINLLIEADLHES